VGGWSTPSTTNTPPPPPLRAVVVTVGLAALIQQLLR
jgi:hypothetical protein